MARPTSICSRIATARFLKYALPAKLVYNVTCLAGPQSAEMQALGACFGLISRPSLSVGWLKPPRKAVVTASGFGLSEVWSISPKPTAIAGPSCARRKDGGKYQGRGGRITARSDGTEKRKNGTVPLVKLKLDCWRRRCKMKLILPATAAQCPDRRRRFGQCGRFWVGAEVRSGLKVSEVESLSEAAVGKSRLWVSQATPNKHLQPNCYRPFFEIHIARQIVLSWNKTCWPAIG